MLHYEILHKFKVNNEIKMVAADSVAKAHIKAEKLFGKEIQYLGIKIK